MNTPSQAQVRRAIAEAQTIVVKVGSSSLTEPSGHLDPQRLNALVAAIVSARSVSTSVRPTWPTSRRAPPSAKAC